MVTDDEDSSTQPVDTGALTDWLSIAVDTAFLTGDGIVGRGLSLIANDDGESSTMPVNTDAEADWLSIPVGDDVLLDYKEIIP